MVNEHEVGLFESVQVRSHWSADEEKWYFSVVDVVQVLTDSTIPKRYWSDLRRKLGKESGQPYEKIVRLKMPAADGRLRETDAADVQTLLRLIQSIPSPKAEPFKQWLARVGYERMQEIADPAQSLDRARENWQKLGRSAKWIQQRMTGQETRNKLTDYWKESGVEQADDFARLNNIIHQEWTGLSVQAHKSLKKLKTQNLRDHMSEAELIFTALAELSTRQIAETGKGKNVVSGSNFLPPAATSRLKKSHSGD